MISRERVDWTTINFVTFKAASIVKIVYGLDMMIDTWNKKTYRIFEFKDYVLDEEIFGKVYKITLILGQDLLEHKIAL